MRLNAGINSIQFGNLSYPLDLDRIVISGDGGEMEIRLVWEPVRSSQ